MHQYCEPQDNVGARGKAGAIAEHSEIRELLSGLATLFYYALIARTRAFKRLFCLDALFLWEMPLFTIVSKIRSEEHTSELQSH